MKTDFVYDVLYTIRYLIKDASSLSRELESLKHENVELASYKRQVLMLEQEKKDLETQVVTLTVESRMATIRQRYSTGILRDKTIADKLLYNPNNDKKVTPSKN